MVKAKFPVRKEWDALTAPKLVEARRIGEVPPTVPTPGVTRLLRAFGELMPRERQQLGPWIDSRDAELMVLTRSGTGWLIRTILWLSRRNSP